MEELLVDEYLLWLSNSVIYITNYKPIVIIIIFIINTELQKALLVGSRDTERAELKAEILMILKIISE